MADSTNISVFGQETSFTERANFYNDINVSGNVNFTGNLYQITVVGSGTSTSQLYVSGITTFGSTGIVQQLFENVNVSSTALTGTVNLDVLSGTLFYYTTDASTNWTFNVRGNSSTSLNSILPIGKSVSITILSTQGSTPRYANTFQVDGVTITPKWIGGVAPSSGTANCINVYTYVVLKTASATYTVIASLGKTT